MKLNNLNIKYKSVRKSRNIVLPTFKSIGVNELINICRDHRQVFRSWNIHAWYAIDLTMGQELNPKYLDF